VQSLFQLSNGMNFKMATVRRNEHQKSVFTITHMKATTPFIVSIQWILT